MILNIAVGNLMLIELYLMRFYFGESSSLAFQDDLAVRYGQAAVTAAIEDGLLDRRRIPCAGGGARFVCQLSDLGCLHAESLIRGDENLSIRQPVELVRSGMARA